MVFLIFLLVQRGNCCYQEAVVDDFVEVAAWVFFI